MGNLSRRVRALTDAEEAEIQNQIAADPDDFDATDDDVAKAKPFATVFPELAESIKRGRGRPPSGNRKPAVTLRLDRETLAKFQATGKDWRARMSDALKAAKI